MAFEAVATQEILGSGGGDVPLVDNDLQTGVHVINRSRIEVAFDPKAKPEDPAYSGNYKITATSELVDEPPAAILALYKGIGFCGWGKQATGYDMNY